MTHESQTALIPTTLPAVPTAVTRLLRFMLTGGTAGLFQIGLMEAFTARGWPAVLANVLAALCGAQLNFVLSSVFTWRDRVPASVWRRWLLYHGTIAGTMFLSIMAFTVLSRIMPDELASATGIALGGVANFVLGDRLVFRLRVAPVPAGHSETLAA